MRVINKTPLPTKFLARMARWVRDEVGMPVNKLEEVVFTKGRMMGRASYAKGFHNRVRHVGVVIGQVVRDPTNDLDDAERYYPLVTHLAAAMKPSLVPPGDLGMIRMAIGQMWIDNAGELVPKWMQGVDQPCPKASKQKQKLITAQKAVEKWTRKAKLAQTKLKIWNRRLKAAERAAQQITSQPHKEGSTPCPVPR